MAYDYTDMSIDDLSKLVSNKRKSQNIFNGTKKWDSPEQLKLNEANNSIRQKLGIASDDMDLKTASELLAKKQEAANPLKGYSSGKAQFSETPLDSYTVKGTDAMYNDFWGSNGEDVVSKIRAENERAGENAYNSAIGNMTEFTGGRLNSWAAKAAADSKQAYADKGDADIQNYVMNMLNAKQNFINNNVNNSKGIWDRAMYEKQQPITNAQEDKRIGVDELLAKGNVANSRISAGASASNAATNAAQLAWAKDPNNPDNIYKLAQANSKSQNNPQSNDAVAKMTSWIYGTKTNEEALQRLRQNKSLVLQQLLEAGKTYEEALSQYSAMESDLSQ